MKLLIYISSLIILQSSYVFPEERNIILFVTDDQSPDAGCYGNKKIKMPNLDKLASDGTLFKHAFATTASCSASRSVILTGLHNHLQSEERGNSLSPKTMPKENVECCCIRMMTSMISSRRSEKGSLLFAFHGRSRAVHPAESTKNENKAWFHRHPHSTGNPLGLAIFFSHTDVQACTAARRPPQGAALGCRGAPVVFSTSPRATSL